MRLLRRRSQKNYASNKRGTALVLIVTLVLFLLNQSHWSPPVQNTLAPATPSKSRNIKSPSKSAGLKPTRSSISTIMGFATGYELNVYRRFVGSLRRSGFEGHIILAVDPDVSSDVTTYLLGQNVTVKKVEYVSCSTHFMNASQATKASERELLSCIQPYNNLKARWGRFPLLRDYLRECETCIGDVLITDVRDTFFQCDPFGYTAPAVRGLQVFEEDKRMTTANWLVRWPVQECKGVSFDEPMLCSGTTAGTRKDILEYLERMHSEMERWLKDPKCHFAINGDDQTILNYLYYTHQLPFAKAIPNRMGIVNTVGHTAAAVRKDHFKYTKKRGIPESEAQVYPYPGTNLSQGVWVGEKFRLTDNKGYFTNLGGTRSCVVHQYDRFGYQLERWLQRHNFD